MGQYFKVVNCSKRQFLEPFKLRSSEKFPTLMFSEDLTRSIAWLTCISENASWLRLKNLNVRTKRFLGSWAGDTVEIIGDYDEEKLCRTVHDEFEDISRDMLAILFDLSDEYVDEAIEAVQEHPYLLDLIRPVAMLDDPPKRLVFQLNQLFPNGWKNELHRDTQPR